MNESYLVKPNTIKDRGLGEIVTAQAASNSAFAAGFEGLTITVHQHRRAALDTIAWFMYGVPPLGPETRP